MALAIQAGGISIRFFKGCVSDAILGPHHFVPEAGDVLRAGARQTKGCRIMFCPHAPVQLDGFVGGEKS